ncbi:MAG TPA: O-antigen ligase family protein [Solirubrobacteraceae bacterium]
MRTSTRLAESTALQGAALLVTGLAFGGLYAYSASRLSPWLLPAMIVAALSVAIAYQRPEIGIALALVLIPMGTLGINPQLMTYAVQAFSVYLACIAFLGWRARGEEASALPRMAPLVLIYLAVALLSVTQSPELHSASRFMRSLLTGGLLFSAVIFTVRSRREILWVLAGAAVSGLIVGLHAIRDYSSGEHAAGFITTTGEVVGRATAGFSQPNQLGGFLVLLVPLGIAGALISPRWRIPFAFAAAAAAAGVYASFSRGALIGLAIVPFFFLRGWRLWILGPLVVLAVVLAAPGLVRERFATLTSSGGEISTRVDIWHTALNIWENHPVLGVGLGGFPQAYEQALVPGKMFLPATIFQPPPHAHNIFLQLMAEQGILGLLAFVAILIAAVRCTARLRRSSDRSARLLGSGLLAALAAFLIHNLFDVTFEDPQTGLYVFVLFGLIAASDLLYRDRPSPVSLPPVSLPT